MQAINRAGEGLISALAAQRPHLFLWLPVFMGIGIILYFTQKTEPDPLFVTTTLFLAITGLMIHWQDRAGRIIMLLITFIAIGFTSASWRTKEVHTPILSSKINGAQVTGTVHKVERMSENNAERAVLDNVTIENLEPQETPRHVRIKFRNSSVLKVGQRISVRAGFNPPSPPVIPGGFDFQRYMYFQSIGAVGFAYGAPEILSDPPRNNANEWIQNLRNQIAQNLSTDLGASGGVASALMVGHRTGIYEADQTAMRGAGLAHMLAISGLHIGLFFGVLFFTVRLIMAAFPKLTLYHPIKKYAAVLAMGGAIFYMLIAGATIPTQRAVLMTFMVFIALLIDRTALSMRMVAFAALIVLLIAPESLLSASFQMSFAAVAALIAFYQAIRPFWSKLHRQSGIMQRIGLYVLGVSLTTIVATFATAPFALFHFQNLAIYSLLANILAMPILAFIVMPCAVLFYILLPFGLQALVTPIIGFGINQILKIAHFVSSLDHAILSASLWPASALATFCTGFILLMLTQGRLKLIALIPLIIFITQITNLKHPDILISSTTDLIAIRQPDGQLTFNTRRTEKFIRRQWLQAFGHDENMKVEKWPKEGTDQNLQCGEQGCRLATPNQNISFLKSAQSFKAECQWATIIIAPEPLPNCENKDIKIIDRTDTKYKGTHAIYLPPLKIRTSNTERHTRPWVAPIKSYRKSYKK